MIEKNQLKFSSPISSHREQNQLLAALPFEDWCLIESQLEWVELLAGSTLHVSGGALRHVYFPTTAVVSLISTLLDGSTVEVAAVGPEGMVGVDAFMGSSNSNDGTSASGTFSVQNTSLVMRSGHGYRMSAQSIANHAKRSAQVMHHLLNYTRTLFSQMSQTSACNRHHSLDQQLARWLLVHLERQGDDELNITQERIASMLGVRREGVTAGAMRLQKAGVIRYGRGQISVLDKEGLKVHSCECHAVIRGAYERLTRDATPQAPSSGDASPISGHFQTGVGRLPSC